MTPQKKKIRLSPSSNSNKRASEPPDSPRKRLKLAPTKEEEMKAKRKKNFIRACEQVSCRNYFDNRARLLLVHLPSCANSSCKHHDKKGENIHEMPSYATESFKTETKNNMWYEALEVCFMCISPTQYLSADVLQGIVEIMLNAHEDTYSDYTVDHLIDKCQIVLMQHFSTHPPCIIKNLRTCYKDFLTSPLICTEDTFSDRIQYECKEGVVKYCMNRLEHELSTNSKDGPLFDKDVNIPEDMKQSVRGLHWQKQKFELYELLDRQDRIDRLFTVLETIIELLQFDLVIWHSRYLAMFYEKPPASLKTTTLYECLVSCYHLLGTHSISRTIPKLNHPPDSDLNKPYQYTQLSRYTNNLGCHIMRSHKPLMAYLLWSDNVLFTGGVTKNCRQILKIFAQMVHLQYPDSAVKIIATWLNTMVQTFYICETNSNMDYPNTSKYCAVFANELHKIISDMPYDSKVRILERIEPKFMRHLVGLLHINKILSTKEDCIMRILINFVEQAKWKVYPPDSSEIKFSGKLFLPPKKVKRKLSYLLKKCVPAIEIAESSVYRKMEHKFEKNKSKHTLNYIIRSLYITLEAYLDAYDVDSVQETWSDLNEQLLNGTLMETESMVSVQNHYSVTESLIKKYRHILQSIKELVTLFDDVKKRNELPEIMNIFSNIGLLDL